MTSTIKVNKIQDSCGSALVTKCGSTITLGASGKTVAIASGASTTGMGRTGTVDWCTTAKTSPLTGVSGKGYFVNTTGGVVTVTLPSSPTAGDIIAISDYANKFATNNLTIGRGGSKINGACADTTLGTNGQSVTLVYVDGTRGWKTVTDSTADVTGIVNYNVRYVVVAGGAGGGTNYGGGGGAGGYRTIACKSFSVTKGTAYPITVGGGGAGAPNPSSPEVGVSGSNSIFSTIISAGGGGGGGSSSAGVAGGSGGGGGNSPPGSAYTGAGAGNTPPVSPPQGNGGAPSTPNGTGGGGGGAGAAGGPNTAAGVGATTAIFGSIPQAPSYGTPGPNPGRYFSGGGGGYSNGTGGAGGGGTAPNDAGCGNTGGGGSACGAGGSGIVIIKYVSTCGSSASGGNATVTDGSDSIKVFTSDGTFTA